MGVAASPDNLSRINAGSMPLLDAEGLAARLGVTARFVRRLVEERRIPYLKIGRLVRFEPAEVELWIGESRVEPARRWPHADRGRAS